MQSGYPGNNISSHHAVKKHPVFMGQSLWFFIKIKDITPLLTCSTSVLRTTASFPNGILAMDWCQKTIKGK